MRSSFCLVVTPGFRTTRTHTYIYTAVMFDPLHVALMRRALVVSTSTYQVPSDGITSATDVKRYFVQGVSLSLKANPQTHHIYMHAWSCILLRYTIKETRVRPRHTAFSHFQYIFPKAYRIFAFLIHFPQGLQHFRPSTTFPPRPTALSLCHDILPPAPPPVFCYITFIFTELTR